MDQMNTQSGQRGQLQTLLDSRQFLNTVAAGIVLQDADGSVLDCNDAAIIMLGATREELAKRRAGDPQWSSVQEDATPFPLEE